MRVTELQAFAEDVLRWNHIANKNLANEANSSLYLDLIREEYQELLDGIEEDNPREVLDAVCDLFWVKVGLLYAQGRDVVAGDYFPKEGITLKAYVARMRALLREPETTPETFLGLWVAMVQGSIMKVSEGLSEVSKSNWSKYPPVGQVISYYGDNINIALEAASDWIECNYPYTDVTGEVVNGRCVFKDGSGKVVKPYMFLEPNLAKLFH